MHAADEHAHVQLHSLSLRHGFQLSVGEVAELKAGMDSANAQIQQMHEDLQAWEQAVSARDAELRNLQVCCHSSFWHAW